MNAETDVLKRADAAFAEALAEALDIREHETGDRSKRVACHTLVLARRFTKDTECLRRIYWAALLHDIGKIGIADAILLKPGARLFAVIDTLDAMTFDRSYRKALSFDQARAEIVSMSGTQFDPAAVQAFLAEEAILREMVAAKCMQLHDASLSGETVLPINTLERNGP